MSGATQAQTAASDAPDAPDASQVPDAPDAPDAPDMQALQAALVALRADGAHRLDPVRFCYLESLSTRLSVASPAVSRILTARLSRAVADYRARLGPVPAAVEALPPTGPVRPFASVYAQRRAVAAGVRPATAAGRFAGDALLSPLAVLNRYINQTARQGVNSAGELAKDAVTAGDDGAPGMKGMAGMTDTLTGVPMDAASANRGELKSARRFSETWSKLQSESQVEQALQRSPENAGPFNPHMLMVRSLARMRDLSPDYLHRFMQHADALLWLDQAGARHNPIPNKTKPAKPVRARK